MQIIRNRTEYDVVRDRVRRRWRHGGDGADPGRRERGDARSGAVLGRDPRHGHVQVALPDAAARAATPERHFGEFDAALGGWSLDGEPYTSAPGTQFDWFRSRMLGGRTNHWGPHLAPLRARTTSAEEHRRALATTGRLPTTTSSRTTTRSISSSASSAPTCRSFTTSPTASSCRRRRRAATSC
jgi:hypothetical protein